MSTTNEPDYYADLTPAAPAQPTPTPPAGKPRKKLHQRWSVRIPVLGFAGLIAIMAASGSGSHPAASTSPAKPAVTAPAHPKAAKPAAPASSAPVAPATTPAPATSQPATSVPAAPAGPTVSEQQALTSAQSYLSDGQGFSRAGLIDQLSSSAGDGFSVADATWAVDHSGANWYAQAVESAKGYMSDGQGFSRTSLIDQLTSPAGEQFTLAQATYAADQVGL